MRQNMPNRIFLKARDARGVAAIEFALLLPLFLLLVIGIIEFSILLYDKAMITNASREGARAGSLYREEDPTQAYIEGIVDNYIENNLISLGNTCNTATVAVNPSLDIGGEKHIEVTVTYPYTFLVLPDIIATFFSGSLNGSISLSAVSIMRKENQYSTSGS